MLTIVFFVFLNLISCNTKSVPNTEANVNDQLVKNIVVFSEIYGVSRYFNPGTEAQKINWDNFAVVGVQEVMRVKDDESLTANLNDLFLPIISNFNIFTIEQYKPYDTIRNTPENIEGYKLCYWKHFGLGAKEQKSYSIYESKIIDAEPKLVSDDVSINDYFEDTLFKNIVYRVPIALYQKDNQTYPQIQIDKFNLISRKAGIDFSEQFSFEDKSYLLGNIIIAWNILKYFYPYFDDIDNIASGKVSREKYWNDVLVKSIEEVLICKNESDYEKILLYIIAKLNDGHGRLLTNQTLENVCYPPIITELVDNKLVVSKVFDSTINSIKPGDVITEIDNDEVFKKINEQENFISAATDGYRKVRCLDEELFKGNCLTKVKLMIGGSQVELTRKIGAINYYDMALDGKKFDIFKEVSNGIYYVNLLNITSNELKEKLKILSKAKGIVFDVRGYPKDDVTFILQHLYKDTLISGRFLIPVLTRPDINKIKFDTTARRWSLPPLSPQINCKIVFLTDAHAISYAESFMAIVENYKLGEIFGENTAGTNGNVNNYSLRGGYNIMWTGMKVLKHDNSNLHAVGITPTRKIIKSIDAIINGQDEVYEQAVKYLSN